MAAEDRPEDDQDPLEGEPSSEGEFGLAADAPGEEPDSPYRNLLFPLVVVPAMIVIVVLLVYTLVGAITGEEATVDENLNRVLHGGSNERTQAAYALVAQLAENHRALIDGEELPWEISDEFAPNLAGALEGLGEDEAQLQYVISSSLHHLGDPAGLVGLRKILALGELFDALGDLGEFGRQGVGVIQVGRLALPVLYFQPPYGNCPNFGDASTYGTHLHYQDREVYQREFHEPRMYRLTIEMLRAGTGGDNPSAYRIALDHQLDRANPVFEQELLFMLNLLQENVGATGVFASDASREDYLGTLHLDWQVFPPGTQVELVRRLIGGRSVSRDEEATVAARVALFSRLRPRAFLRGTGGLNSYVGAQYADDLVVFENTRYGNALYILYDNWEEVSQRSRLELLRGTDANFDRIVHTEGWEEAFRKNLQREKHRRGIRD